jgi:hypothetical protein
MRVGYGLYIPFPDIHYSLLSRLRTITNQKQTKATLSWWSNFIGRQLLVLDLARGTQYVLLDLVILGNRYALTWLGPLVTLWAIQAKGWPLIAIFWGVWDLLLLVCTIDVSFVQAGTTP